MAIQKITSGIIQDGAVAAADIVSVANTAITGNIASSQIAPNQTLNGNVSVTGTLSASGNLTGAVGAASSWLISNNTSDAADSSRLVVNGGGATGTDRGGRAVFYGNEYAGNNGAVEITSGAVAGSTLILQGSNATSHVKQIIESNTVTDVTSTGLAVTGLVDISAATSGQIKFPATQNASANANTLDDYEEGTWTATYGVATTTGNYTKIGRTVALQVTLTGAATFTQVTGLPFNGATYTPATTSRGNGSNIDITTINIGQLDTYLQFTTSSGAQQTIITSGTVRIDIQCTYQTT